MSTMSLSKAPEQEHFGISDGALGCQSNDTDTRNDPGGATLFINVHCPDGILFVT